MTDSKNDNEWAESECFYIAQQIAIEALNAEEESS